MEQAPQRQKWQIQPGQKTKIAIALVLCLVVLLTGLGALAYGYGSAYDGQVFKGVKVGGVVLDGSSPSEAEVRLNRLIQERMGDGFDFSVDGKTVRVNNREGESQIVTYDVKNAVVKAYETGRSGRLIQDVVSRARLLTYSVNIPLRPVIDTTLAQERLDAAVGAYRKLPKDAALRISFDAASTTEPIVTIAPEQSGLEVETARGIEKLAKQANAVRFEPIVLESRSSSPRIAGQMLEPLQAEAVTMVKRAPFKLEAEKKTWTVSREMLTNWIKPEISEDGSVSLGLSVELTDAALRELTQSILQVPKDGIFVLAEDNTLKEFEAPVAGVLVNAINTIQNIYQGWQSGSSTMALALDRVTPKIAGPDAERLGIREILGTGRSSFAGSPTNRRKNMALGVKHMNGVLLAPGEEFSQLKVLGEIDGDHGWFPELVIKGNQTVPEFGGGLCQVGTTSFRMALDAGLKITQRRNHSYRVSYYEPVGTDATIYDPAPDFRFKNDTANYMLITAIIQNGDDLIFTAWGTKDGRVAKQENYKVFGITPAPPTRYIETTDLAPGKVKCTETAHAGASASFDYVVTQADGAAVKETFSSYYKPWGAVCLRGVATLSSAPADTSGEPVSLTE